MTPTFIEYFHALHGYDPFPWQSRLAERVADEGWPAALALPTAAGKTACLDIAAWALAQEAATESAPRRMPRRIILVVDRRIVVDDAFARARKIAGSICQATGGPLAGMKEALNRLGGEVPLHATVLRGAIHRDERWARTPLQPTLVVSTVDQVGSRLLFRGYGLNPNAYSIHAGLLAYDTLLILDEAHLSRPFEETLEWIAHHRTLGEKPIDLPFAFVRMTATPPPGGELFEATAEDRRHPVLGRRLRASKPTLLPEPVEPRKLPQTLAAKGAEAATPGSTVAIVVNRVALARAVFEELTRKHQKGRADVILLTGRSRSHERDQLIGKYSNRLRSGRDRSLHRDANPLIVVSTQCIEAGADLDFDHLVTECAPLDALRQRFGRLDRLGELSAEAAESQDEPDDLFSSAPPVEEGTQNSPRATILIDAKSAKDSNDDPVYGPALSATWEWLVTASRKGGVDFGISALTPPDGPELESLLSPRKSAPLLQRAYCDLLVQTSPLPVPSPDPAAFLHGIDRGDPEVQIVWRADLGEDPEKWSDIVALCPPVAGEALSLRLSAARAWLESLATAENGDDTLMDDCDIEGMVPPPPAKNIRRASRNPEESEPGEEDPDAGGDDFEEDAAPAPASFRGRNAVLRWKGLESSAIAHQPSEIRPGDTLVVPSSHGGCDAYGWNPASAHPVEDIATAARAKAGRGRVLRFHPSITDTDDEVLRTALSPLLSLTAAAVPDEGLQALVAGLLEEAPDATLPPGYRIVLHPSGKGAVLIWPQARSNATFSDADDSSSLAGRGQSVTLDRHNRAVSEEAARFSRASGLPEEITSVLALAGALHDLGKADPRFQTMLAGGNRLLALRGGALLAKSDRTPRTRAEASRIRDVSGYPPGGRHELLSTRLIESDPSLLESVADPELLLHLVASHHGRCRPFAPWIDDAEPVDVTVAADGHTLRATSATGLERLDSGVATRFFRLLRRYGWWGLSYLECLVRLADHRVSERGPQED